MSGTDLVLASASPRRAQLLHQLGFEFRIAAQDIDESQRPNEEPDKYVARMAHEKRAALQSRGEHAALLLAADTVVVQGNRIFGKPDDRAQCVDMLTSLSANRHEVLTAVSAGIGKQALNVCVASSVWFREISRREAQAYWATGEPCDKAGGYAIQGMGATFVQRIEGSYSAVMGLPAFEVCQLLGQFSCVPLWQQKQRLRDG